MTGGATIDAGDCPLAITSFPREHSVQRLGRRASQYRELPAERSARAVAGAGSGGRSARPARKNDRRADEARSRAEGTSTEASPPRADSCTNGRRPERRAAPRRRQADRCGVLRRATRGRARHARDRARAARWGALPRHGRREGGRDGDRGARAAESAAAERADEPAPSPPSPPSTLPRIGFVATTVGVVGLGVGAVATGIAATKLVDAKAACADYPHCTTAAQATAASD